MSDAIDLRSDTVTVPSPEMRQVIAEAEVGDDVLGDDPTVIRLEAMTAQLLGKEAALFVASGTMANQIAIRILTAPGDEVLAETYSHVLQHEAGGLAVNSGCFHRGVEGDRGVLDVSQLEPLIQPDDVHCPVTRLVCLENTHNHAQGRVYPLKKIEAIGGWAKANGLAMHLDGARLMNAVAASGIPAAQWCGPFDTVNICFSKGLGAPVGSAIAASKPLIDKARRVRKLFGGGWRQAGLLAAAGIYALEHNVDRLAEDHANARILAEAIAEFPFFKLNVEDIETNLVWFDVDDSVISADEVTARLEKRGVRILNLGPRLARAVTHLDVTREQAERAAAIIREEFGGLEAKG